MYAKANTKVIEACFSLGVMIKPNTVVAFAYKQ